MWGWWDNYGGQSLGIAMMCNRNISPFTLAGHAVNIADDIQGTFPMASAIAVLPPVAPSRVDGPMFELDFSNAWQAEPRGVITPLSLRHAMYVEARATARGLEMTLSEGEKGSGPPSLRRSYALGETETFQNPRFATRKTNVSLSSRKGDIELTDLTIEGAFAERGRAVAGRCRQRARGPTSAVSRRAQKCSAAVPRAPSGGRPVRALRGRRRRVRDGSIRGCPRKVPSG